MATRDLRGHSSDVEALRKYAHLGNKAHADGLQLHSDLGAVSQERSSLVSQDSRLRGLG